MEAVEINAGTWYLRALRADDRITDVPALSDLGVADASSFVASAADGWRRETEFVWGVCIPTTGELVCLIGVTPEGGDHQRGRLWGRARTGHGAALDAAAAPVARFAQGALGVTVGALSDALPT
ncbi:hypothetical protein AAFP35_07230 [Gordonia sp. CPCC 206044]|uniref:hypothetical protein n=1 Tax=Gordonia sp. CPCC 206044 TaxID=3140793 RepID=UPI003AF36E94